MTSLEKEKENWGIYWKIKHSNPIEKKDIGFVIKK